MPSRRRRAGHGEARLGSRRRSRFPRSSNSGSSISRKHVIAPAGRGSRSGANRHVRWESCEACGLRLSYTPESCMGLTRSDPSSGTTPSGHRGPDQREEAREQEHRAGGQEDRLYHAQQPSLENQLKAVRKKEEWVKLQTAKDAQNKGYPEPKFDDKWTEAENQFLESTDPAALGSDSAPLDHTSNQFCPPMTPEELTAYKKQLEEEMTQAPGRKARKAEESAENLEYSQRTYSRPGRMDTWCRMARAWGWTMRFHLQAIQLPIFTPPLWQFLRKPKWLIPQRATAQVSPQLLAFFRRNLPQALCLRSLLLVARRKKDNDDNEVLVNTLADEETAFLVQELDKFNSEIDEPCATLNVLAPDGCPPTMLELCCEEDSGLTKAIERRGGRGIRCGLFNGCDLNKQSGFNKVMALIDRGGKAWRSLGAAQLQAFKSWTSRRQRAWRKFRRRLLSLANLLVVLWHWWNSKWLEVAKLSKSGHATTKAGSSTASKPFGIAENTTRPMPMAVPMDFVHHVVEQ